MVDEDVLHNEDEALAYPLAIPNLRGSGLPYIEPLAMWNAILGDLILNTPAPVMAARFHKGLAKAIAAMARKLARREATPTGRASTRSRCRAAASRTAFCSKRLRAGLKRKISPCSPTRRCPPMTAASRSARRRSAPRI